MVGLRQVVVFTAFLFTTAPHIVTAQACDAKFQIIPGHSACLTPSVNLVTSIIPDTAAITEIVDRHNHWRANVDPTASNMLKMSWDEELALVAQAWAENCDISHDGNYARMIPGRYNAGQNLFLSSGHVEWTSIVDVWRAEKDFFVYGSGSTGPQVGHYTQVVWAETHKIGCGSATCSDGSTNINFYVCNYSPAGNSVSSINYPYISGSPCGDCPDSCNNNLCDCSSVNCYNGGTLDVNTCTCSCKNSASYYVGEECVLNCTGIGTPSCGFTEAQCSVYSNVPFDCPVTCGFCPDADSTYLLTDTGSETVTSGGGAGTTEDLEYACYPNGTIKVTNPDPGTYPFALAVQDEGQASATLCTVSSSGSEIVITDCAKDSDITVFFSNVEDDIVFAGQTFEAYIIMCNELPVAGVTRIVTDELGATMEFTTQDPVTPAFSVTSALRTSSATGNIVNTASVGDDLFWTIDIPASYNGQPSCTAYSGTSSSGALNSVLTTDGCSTDDDRNGDFDNELILFHIKRLWANLHVFKFYNADSVYFACTVKVCPSTSTDCDLSCGRKKRDTDSHTGEGTIMVFKTGNQLRITAQGRSSAYISVLARGTCQKENGIKYVCIGSSVLVASAVFVSKL